MKSIARCLRLNQLINSTCNFSNDIQLFQSEYPWLTWQIKGGLFLPAQILAHLWRLGYSPEDVIGNIFRVCKTYQMPEYLKLEFIKVGTNSAPDGAFLRRGCDQGQPQGFLFKICCILAQRKCFLTHACLLSHCIISLSVRSHLEFSI